MNIKILTKTQINSLPLIYPEVVLYSLYSNGTANDFTNSERNLFGSMRSLEMISQTVGKSVLNSLIKVCRYEIFSNAGCYKFSFTDKYTTKGANKIMDIIIQDIIKNKELKELIEKSNELYLGYNEENLFNILSTPFGIAGAVSKITKKRARLDDFTNIRRNLRLCYVALWCLDNILTLASYIVQLRNIIKQMPDYNKEEPNTVVIVMETNHVDKFHNYNEPEYLEIIQFFRQEQDKLFDILINEHPQHNIEIEM